MAGGGIGGGKTPPPPPSQPFSYQDSNCVNNFLDHSAFSLHNENEIKSCFLICLFFLCLR